MAIEKRIRLSNRVSQGWICYFFLISRPNHDDGFGRKNSTSFSILFGMNRARGVRGFSGVSRHFLPSFLSFPRDIL